MSLLFLSDSSLVADAFRVQMSTRSSSNFSRKPSGLSMRSWASCKAVFPSGVSNSVSIFLSLAASKIRSVFRPPDTAATWRTDRPEL